MSCFDFPTLALVWPALFIFWILFISSNYHEQREAKEDLMLQSALKEFRRLVAADSHPIQALKEES
ncbi:MULTISPECIES: hypothetical protein [Sulfurospirillum]|uniref:Uncharacterized protein n=4 Tax=Sulfurospirillum TaxID=57665 RepID=A0A1Y0HL35_9BACT|nr:MULTISPECIES: hypothetical protein [Sulfurospirillum]AHJ12841.1 hypothetical protein SMUL_1581 [Sulfurospirillum multivorans DSM 12446]AOO65317.1 hypothetical protein SHALO_1542 [Sulfurospirillum halorespirans DSM 13726]ARU48798.1 hypothetical protein Sdiek1_1635 [Sulfurospirillum diekertiae]ASC93619.1 hypothetical protein Sdiek2_1601 [Sulfurospirillum diekertiae]ATB69662.1 hypothetical protein SJPD1_1553 [Sulfurospirillum diekertiae]